MDGKREVLSGPLESQDGITIHHDFCIKDSKYYGTYRHLVRACRTNPMIHFCFAMMETLRRCIWLLYKRSGKIIYHHTVRFREKVLQAVAFRFRGVQEHSIYKKKKRKNAYLVLESCHMKDLLLAHIEPDLQDIIGGNRWHKHI